MSIQDEFDVQRVIAAIRSEIATLENGGDIINQHATELAEYTVQLARLQAQVEQLTTERDAALAELEGNVAYQTEALARATAAIASGDQAQLQAVLQFAGASFAEKARLKKLEQAAALRAQAEELEASAQP